MAYLRGSEPVEKELSKTQSWIEWADPILFGGNGNPGVVREHQQDRDRRTQRELDNDQYNKRVVALVAILGTAAPVLIKVAELLHWIPK